MKTIDEIIVELKTETPILHYGNEENGYEIVNEMEYETIIQERAEWRFNRNQELLDKAQAEADKAATKASALAKLSALGLSDDEVKSIVG